MKSALALASVRSMIFPTLQAMGGLQHRWFHHCTALHCTALHCTALHCTALHCTGPRLKDFRAVNLVHARRPEEILCPVNATSPLIAGLYATLSPRRLN
jgi:hypothetical protein